VSAIVGGLIQTHGELLHFDTLGYVLVCTTMISLTLMYFIDRKIGGERSSGDAREPQAPTQETVAVAE
jgi:hypothetical protein